jgi:translocator protein
MERPVTNNKLASAAVLALFFALVLVTGYAAAMATEPNIAGWYAHLAKPSFNPPDSVFAPVWTALYVMMAIAAWRVWRVGGIFSSAMLLWFVQLALNFAWSFIFFSAHQPGFALIDIAVLWLLVALTMITFFRIDAIAGLLFVPYLAWVSFAGLLNEAIWRLNG